METKQHVNKKNQWVNEEIKEEIRKYLATNLNKAITFQKSMECNKTREVYTDRGLPHETRKMSNKPPNLPSKGIRKGTNKNQSQKKEGNNKDQRRNKLNRDKKMMWKRSIKPRTGFWKR